MAFISWINQWKKIQCKKLKLKKKTFIINFFFCKLFRWFDKYLFYTLRIQRKNTHSHKFDNSIKVDFKVYNAEKKCTQLKFLIIFVLRISCPLNIY